MAQANLKSMDVSTLLDLRGKIDALLAGRRKELEAQLAAISDGPATVGKVRTRNGRGKSLKGRKVPAQFRSRKNPKLTWAGRGATPLWMREEMKGTKLKKEDFRIK